MRSVLIILNWMPLFWKQELGMFLCIYTRIRRQDKNVPLIFGKKDVEKKLWPTCRKIVFEDHGITINFINDVMKHM